MVICTIHDDNVFLRNYRIFFQGLAEDLEASFEGFKHSRIKAEKAFRKELYNGDESQRSHNFWSEE